MQAGPHKLEHAHLPPTSPPRPSRERVEQLRHKKVLRGRTASSTEPEGLESNGLNAA